MNGTSTPYRIGTSGWTYDHWRGLFYPENLPKTRWFAHYAQTFDTVEINATFYRTFGESTYRKWREQAPEGFTYVLKAPKPITHYKFLQDVEADIRAFWESAALLSGKLGMILLQLAPSTPYDPERLRAALRAFPDPARVAVEFRSERWLTDETRALLEESGACFCDADAPRAPLRGWLTGRTAYLRLHGRSRWYAHCYTDAELDEIAALARRHVEQGAERVYIFFNNDFEGYAPENAHALIQRLAPR